MEETVSHRRLLGQDVKMRWQARLTASVLLLLLPHCDSHADSSRTEIFDAPDVRIEAIDRKVPGFYVSKTNDLKLRCAIRAPSSVRLSESTRQIVWRYNEEDVIKAGLPTGTFQVDRDTLLLKASADAELLVGKYSCNVTWPTYGSALSPPVQVQLANLKKFKGDPVSEERVVVGNTAYLPCHAPESLPGPAKIWFIFNGSKEIIFNHDRYFLTPNGLQIGRAEKSDRGTYICRAMNPLSGHSRDSKPIELVVLDDAKPTTTTTSPAAEDQGARPSPHLHQRNTVDVRRGDNVTLECVMVSGPGRTTSVRWEKYGRTLPPMEKRKQVLGNMILYNVTKEDEGTYICRGGDNGDGSAAEKRLPLSNSPPRYVMYSLRVYDPLKAKLTIERDTEDDDKSASSGFAYRLTCQAATGLSSDLEFWVNGRPLLTQSLNPVRTKFQSGESPKWSFTLTESTLRTGVYQCMVRGRGPFDDATVDSDNLYVDSWFVPSSTRKGEQDDWSTASGMEDSAGVTRSAGAFELDHATVSSRRHPPKIKAAPENDTTSVGSSVTFVCQVSANTDVVYWLKDGERIMDYYTDEDEDDGDNTDDQSTRRYRRIGTGSLNIETTTESDRGWYTCVAMNSFGNATAKAYLDFERQVVDDGQRRPTFPGLQANSPEDDDEGEEEKSRDNRKNVKKKKIRLDAPSVFRYSNTSVHLQWKVTSEQRRANGGIRFFKLQYKKMVKGTDEKDPQWKTLDQELPSHSHSGTIDGLEPGQKYKFRYAVVYDNNDQAQSRMTSPYEMTIEKKLEGPKMAPMLTSVKAVSWSAISLTWDYPSAEQAPVEGFIIMYRRIYYAETSVEYQNETVIGRWSREHVLSHLLPATPYKIKMVAYNTGGRSRESNVVEESTLGTDGTRPPRTFDSAAHAERPVGHPTYRSDSSYSVTRTSSDVSSAPAPYANRTDKNGGVLSWLTKSEMAVYAVGGVLGALFIIAVIIVIVCAVKQRSQKKMVNAAQGKYRDTSKKIYREQELCNDRSVMQQMYPPISNSTSFQHSTADSADDDHDECPPPPPAPSQSTLGLVRATSQIPPPPSMTGYSNGSARQGAGIIMNLYTNPLDYDDGDESRRPDRRLGILSRTTDLIDGEEAEELLSAEDRLLADAFAPDCDLNKNDVRYGIRGVGGLNGSTNGRHHRPVPPPLILTSASALTSTGPFANSFSHNVSFLSSSSPHASLASNYSSSNTGDGHSSSSNVGVGNNHTPLLPAPLFSQPILNDDLLDIGDEKRKRIPTPIPVLQSQKNTPSLKSSDSTSRTERKLQQRLDDAGSTKGHHGNGGILNGAASPMSVSSHASIGSGSATSANGSRPNFSTFKPEPNRHHLLLYKNRLSDGYCSDA